jgi:putative spermidine/putrescine transport system permease protein
MKRDNKQLSMPGAAHLTPNGPLLAFLLAPIAIVLVFALNPTPYISFPPSASACAGSRSSSAARFANALPSLWVAAACWSCRS